MAKEEDPLDLEVARRKAAEKQLLVSYAKLQQAHEDLKTSQKSLVQNEKMASLGILSAGIAHEINNPVGYILSNLTTLSEYLPGIDKTYKEMRALISEIDKSNPLYERRLKIERVIEERDINYLREDTLDLVEETKEGANRVLAIVRGLRNFAHTDDEAMKPADINECLQSTLNLVNNELKYHCHIETSYGELPNIHCSISKLGQVFMNILINAGHAIEDKGVISVTTRQSDDSVYIDIKDNGSGMSEATVQNIFQPFFTTKPKGRGTGLGLAISFGIVQEHGGAINVDSTEGVGTVFSIQLPVSGPAGPAQDLSMISA